MSPFQTLYSSYVICAPGVADFLSHEIFYLLVTAQADNNKTRHAAANIFIFFIPFLLFFNMKIDVFGQRKQSQETGVKDIAGLVLLGFRPFTTCLSDSSATFLRVPHQAKYRSFRYEFHTKCIPVFLKTNHFQIETLKSVPPISGVGVNTTS